MRLLVLAMCNDDDKEISVVNDKNPKQNQSHYSVVKGFEMNDCNPSDKVLYLFVMWGIVLPLVAAAGLVGNVLTMLVLWQGELSSTTILYLRGLVITDTGILI
ncbi:hypothetical protein PoB_003688400 [Plakobranchus ocellatus]|uniref:G-protein coupled receptors family 1 profile domain-containing protein n=1 Tax=Plakobranchus ocellatus TaxID=259542 RepID=A0AAV4AW87_9GAST|nr:hypothetical protein PoB_003688400 [Plakobranchus ocellatus]